MKSQTTFEIFQFENRPPPVGVKTKMDFHVSLGFLGYSNQIDFVMSSFASRARVKKFIELT